MSKVRALLFALMLALPLSADAAISFIASSQADLATTQSRTLTEPTGTAQNDLVIVKCYATVTTAITWTDPSDFTELEQEQVALGTINANVYLGYKVRGATAGQALTFSHADTADSVSCAALTYRGIDTATPFDVTYVTANHLEVGATNNPNMTPEDITTATNGAWVVILEGMSQDISGAAGPSAGYTEDADHLEGNGADVGIYAQHKAIPTAGIETPGVFTHTDDGAGADPDPFSITLAIKPAAAGDPPAFTAGPTYTPGTGGGTVGGTVDADATVYAVDYNPGNSVPTCTQIKAGQNQLGAAALIAANEAWSATVANSFALTAFNTPPRHDIAVCASNGDGDSAVTEFTDQDRSAESGEAIVAIASISATGICDLDSYFTPDCAIGDAFEYEDDTNESANCNVLFDTDGDLTWYDSTDGVNTEDLHPGIDETGDAGDDSIADCAGKRTFNISYQDVSSTTTGLFTAPAVGNFTTDDLVCQGNAAPTFLGQETPAVHIEDAAMQTADLDQNFADADGDALSYAVTTESLPNGESLGGTRNKDWSGTPDTEDEAGVSVGITATDECGDSVEGFFAVYVTDDAITAPDCVADTVVECLAELDTVRPWLESDAQLSATFAFSLTVPVGDIISQDPAAAATLTAFELLEVVVSLGVQPVDGGKRRKLNLGLGIDLSVVFDPLTPINDDFWLSERAA